MLTGEHHPTVKLPSIHANVQAVQFSWDPYETGLENPLLSAGVISIRPLRGALEAGQSTLLHVTISAGCGPRFLGQQPMACAVRLAPPTTVRTSEQTNRYRVGVCLNNLLLGSVLSVAVVSVVVGHCSSPIPGMLLVRREKKRKVLLREGG